MQKQKVLSLVSIMVVALTLFALSGNSISASMAQATAPATKPAATNTPGPTPTPPSVKPQAVTFTGTGKITGPLSGEATSLTGDGATFPEPLYDAWIAPYAALTNVQINYRGNGSGQGRSDFIAQSVDFAGSDAPMSDAEITKAAGTGGAEVHIASVMGGIVAVYNIPELVGKDALKLTGDELAQIYQGKIKTWNDPLLVADNPDLKAVNQPIFLRVRSDSSGTTQNFTAFLSLSNKDWPPTRNQRRRSRGRLKRPIRPISSRLLAIPVFVTQLPAPSIPSAMSNFTMLLRRKCSSLPLRTVTNSSPPARLRSRLPQPVSLCPMTCASC